VSRISTVVISDVATSQLIGRPLSDEPLVMRR
jgi:hypothetical protein